MGIDFRFALRTLGKNPAVNAVAVVCLALAMGVNSTVFSLVDGLWLRPLPVERPSELIDVQSTVKGRSSRVSYPDYLDFREQSRSLAGLLAEIRFGPFLVIDGNTEPAMTAVASENYFTMLGVRAALGRVFVASEREPVMVISYGLWQRRFGSDPHAIGKQVMLGGSSYTVIGVAPPGFKGTSHLLDIDLWTPISSWTAANPRASGMFAARNTRQFDLLGRLRPGAPVEQARAELEGIARNLEQAWPATNRNCAITVRKVSARAGWLPYFLLGIVGLVLLIACANVANLLLGRAAARRREMAIRAASGAGRGRLMRQLLIESALLAALSTAGGLLLAAWLIRLLPALLVAPNTIRLGFEFLLDGRVLAFTLAASLSTVLLFGLLPAWQASRPDLALVLKSESFAGGARRRFLSRNVLVVGQITISLVALTCAGLLVRAFVAGLKMDLGFARKDLLLVRVDTPYRPQQARAFFAALSDRVRGMAGVKQLTTARRPPMWLSEGGASVDVTVPGYVAPDGASKFAIKDLVTGLNYFRTLGIRLLAGRDFDGRDNETGGKVAIVNESMARRFWPAESPLGKRIVIGSQEREIVGVVQDTKINHPDEPPELYLYRPFPQTSLTYMVLIIETSGDPMRYAAPVRAEIAAMDKTVRVYEVWTMGGLLRNRFFEREQSAAVVGTLGLLAMILASIGLYGVISYSVVQRTHEIGVRMAMGASRRDAMALVLWQGLRLSLIGVAIGLAAAAAITPFIASMLYGVSPRDPWTFGIVAVLMVGVSVIASYFPARRATRVDPLVALRYDA